MCASTSRIFPKSVTSGGRPRRMASNPVILCVNGGSSSLKVALFRLTMREKSEIAREVVLGKDPSASLHGVLDTFEARGLPAPDAAGHRLVHGGPHHQYPE